MANSGTLTWILMGIVTAGGVLGQVMDDYLAEEAECPTPGIKMLSKDVPWGVPGRAYLTLPGGLRIAPSKIPNAGFGILSDTFIRKYTWLGEYEGEIVDKKNGDDISWYTWSVHRNDEETAYVDGYHLDRSNYIRFVNTPNRHVDENVWPLECYGKVFYVTVRDIIPGEELLVFYGSDYALHLGIDLNDYFDVGPAYREHGLDLNNSTHRDILTDLDIEFHDLCGECLRHFNLTQSVLHLKT